MRSVDLLNFKTKVDNLIPQVILYAHSDEYSPSGTPLECCYSAFDAAAFWCEMAAWLAFTGMAVLSLLASFSHHRPFHRAVFGLVSTAFLA